MRRCSSKKDQALTLALHKGTTVYFQQNVYPMLPHSIQSELVLYGLIVSRSFAKWIFHRKVKSWARLFVRSDHSLLCKTYLWGSNWLHRKETPHPQQKRNSGHLQLYSRLLNHRLDRGATPIRSGDFRFELNGLKAYQLPANGVNGNYLTVWWKNVCSQPTPQ